MAGRRVLTREGERRLPEPQEGAQGCCGAAGAAGACVPASGADLTASSPLPGVVGVFMGKMGGVPGSETL